MSDKPDESKPVTGAEHSSAEHADADLVPREDAARPTAAAPGVVAGKARRGMFNVADTGDTSGFGGLRLCGESGHIGGHPAQLAARGHD